LAPETILKGFSPEGSPLTEIKGELRKEKVKPMSKGK
jgi:hypothetical protein